MQSNNSKTFELVLTALFAAIICVMAVTPLGYIPLVVINATTIHIPVIIGSLFLGPKKGAFLGGVFGLTSFLKSTLAPASLSAFVFSPVIAVSTLNPAGAAATAAVIFKSLFIAFVPRILIGVVPYFVYIGIKKLIASDKVAKPLGFILAGFAGSMTNTLLVMGSIFVLYKEPYSEAVGVAADALLAMIGGIISFNGVIEAIVAAIIVNLVGLVLDKIKPAGVYSGKKNGNVKTVTSASDVQQMAQ